MHADDQGNAIHLTEYFAVADGHTGTGCGRSHHLSTCCCGQPVMVEDGLHAVTLSCASQLCPYNLNLSYCNDVDEDSEYGAGDDIANSDGVEIGAGSGENDGDDSPWSYDVGADLDSMCEHLANLSGPPFAGCFGLSGEAYAGLYKHGLQGYLTLSEVMAGFDAYTSGRITRLPQFGAKLKAIADESTCRSSREASVKALLQCCGRVPSWVGETSSIHSTLCHMESAAGQPCPSCTRLSKSSNIKLAARAIRTTRRISKLQAAAGRAGTDVDGTGVYGSIWPS
jgi:hypothetical protein